MRLDSVLRSAVTIAQRHGSYNEDVIPMMAGIRDRRNPGPGAKTGQNLDEKVLPKLERGRPSQALIRRRRCKF
jgi:hypothetical protein